MKVDDHEYLQGAAAFARGDRLRSAIAFFRQALRR